MDNNRQELFDRAVKDYDEMVDFLKQTAAEIQKAVESYSIDNMLKQFDCILQALLLRVGFADFELCDYEIEFIKRIAKHYSVIDGDLHIPKEDQAEAQKFFEQKANEVLNSAAGFFEPIAIVDVCVPDLDFYDFICRRLAVIVASFCAMDGNITKSESTMANDLVNQYISDPYYKVKDGVERMLRERGEVLATSDAPASGSSAGYDSGASSGFTVSFSDNPPIEAPAPTAPLAGNDGIGPLRCEQGREKPVASSPNPPPPAKQDDGIGPLRCEQGRGKPGASSPNPPPPAKQDDGIGPLRCEQQGSGQTGGRRGAFKAKKESFSGGHNYTANKSAYPETVIYIETERNTSGTGFLITADGYALTCAHVVNGCDNVTAKVTKTNGECEMLRAQVVAYDQRVDIAVIKLDMPQDGKPFVYAQLQKERDATHIGEDIAILGYPFGRILSDEVKSLAVSFTKGHISSHQQRNGRPISFLDIAARCGNSGGPVTSLETGMVIGLLCGSIAAGREEINYMSPIKLFWETFTEE